MGSRTRTTAALIAGIVLAWLLFAGLAALLNREHTPPDAVQQAQAKARQRSQQRKRTVKTRLAQTPSQTAQTTPSPSQPEKPKEPEKPKPVETPDGQIVETARPETEERPEVARYLGRYDMKVAKEQKSEGQKRKTQDLGKMEIDNPS